LLVTSSVSDEYDLLLVIEKQRKDYAFQHQFNEKPSIRRAAQALLVIPSALDRCHVALSMADLV
jgi:hypothetical protein